MIGQKLTTPSHRMTTMSYSATLRRARRAISRRQGTAAFEETRNSAIVSGQPVPLLTFVRVNSSTALISQVATISAVLRSCCRRKYPLFHLSLAIRAQVRKFWLDSRARKAHLTSAATCSAEPTRVVCPKSSSRAFLISKLLSRKSARRSVVIIVEAVFQLAH